MIYNVTATSSIIRYWLIDYLTIFLSIYLGWSYIWRRHACCDQHGDCHGLRLGPLQQCKVCTKWQVIIYNNKIIALIIIRSTIERKKSKKLFHSVEFSKNEILSLENPLNLVTVCGPLDDNRPRFLHDSEAYFVLW